MWCADGIIAGLVARYINVREFIGPHRAFINFMKAETGMCGKAGLMFCNIDKIKL